MKRSQWVQYWQSLLEQFDYSSHRKDDMKSDTSPDKLSPIHWKSCVVNPSEGRVGRGVFAESVVVRPEYLCATALRVLPSVRVLH